ncbi:MAG: LCP family protein, partial [Candidatus Nanopelagicales bacterium]
MHKRAVGAVVLLGLVIVATVALLLVRRDPSPPPPVVPEAPDTRTLLVQLRDPALLARASVLVGVEQERLDQLWWTTQWWVDQIGSEEVSAAELGRKPVPYVMETVQDQIDVKIDDAWVLDRLAFAGLVDAVGGVRIDVAEPTIYLTDRGDEAVLQAGVQTVSGAQAADYVLDAALRDETTRLRRFQAVWDQVLRRFPTDSEKARALVVSLGALSKATMPNEALSTLLSDAHALRIAGDYAQATVALDDQNRIRVRPPQGVR